MKDGGGQMCVGTKKHTTIGHSHACHIECMVPGTFEVDRTLLLSFGSAQCGSAELPVVTMWTQFMGTFAIPQHLQLEQH